MSSLFDLAEVIPGRSATRSKKVFARWAAYADGAIVTDVDGNKYIDMGCALGAISLGYRPRQLYGSGVCTLPYSVEVEAARLVLQHVAPWASYIKWVKTGSEATHAAYRIAKAATGRPVVCRFDGAYHGWHEWSSDDAGALSYKPEADWDLEWWARSRGGFAAVFYEPSRFEPVDVGFLQKLREYCTRTGALLVFDEMIYGGRWALGGCTEYHGVTPDLACFGKAYGNGQSVAFVVGRDALRDHGEMVSGTFSGDSIGLQALCDTIETYISEPVISTLWARAYYLHTLFSKAIPASFATLTGPAPLMGIRYAHPEHKQPFVEAMAKRGVLCYGDWLMVMFSHSDDHMYQVVEAAEAAAREVSS